MTCRYRYRMTCNTRKQILLSSFSPNFCQYCFYLWIPFQTYLSAHLNTFDLAFVLSWGCHSSLKMPVWGNSSNLSQKPCPQPQTGSHSWWFGASLPTKRCSSRCYLMTISCHECSNCGILNWNRVSFRSSPTRKPCSRIGFWMFGVPRQAGKFNLSLAGWQATFCCCTWLYELLHQEAALIVSAMISHSWRFVLWG